MNIGITQTYNEELAQDPKATAFFKAWETDLKTFPGIDPAEGIDRDESYRAWIIFPEDLAN